MPRYIDADKLIAEYDRVHMGPPGGARKLMEDAPTADVVEVVRCKDCKHQPNLKTRTRGMMWCRKFRNEVTAKHFCSYGERKGGEG